MKRKGDIILEYEPRTLAIPPLGGSYSGPTVSTFLDIPLSIISGLTWTSLSVIVKLQLLLYISLSSLMKTMDDIETILEYEEK